jgi:lipopolysaccharide export system permease protein
MSGSTAMAIRYNAAMNSLGRYIFRQLAGPLFFVTITLTGVVWLTQSLRFLDLVINRGLSTSGFLYLTLLLLPGFFTLILPIAAFCAVLFVYYRLDSDSELVVMRATGVSQARLVQPALALGGLLAIVLFALTLYLQPLGFRAFKDMQFVVRHNYAPVLIQEGVFNSFITDVTVYVRERQANGELLGLLIHDSRNADRPVTMMAERGKLVMTDEGPRFVMVSGNRQEVERANGRVSLLYFEQYTLDLGEIASSPQVRWREAGERFIGELFRPGNGPDDIRNADKLRAEGHRRLVTPFYAIALAMIALAGVISGEFRRRARWRRLAVAGIGAIVFELTALGLGPLVTSVPALAPAYYLHVIVTLAISAWLIFASAQAAPSNQRVSRYA